MKSNLELWQKYGQHLIPVMPFMDNVIDRCEGAYLIDVEGNRILDLAAGQFCCTLGHNHPDFVAALSKELQRNLHTGSQYVTESVFEAAAAVAEIAPEHLTNVVFLSTGSEANEFAIRLAKAYTGRTGIMGFDRGYYGISLGTRSLSAISIDHVDFSPQIADTYHLIAPNGPRCPIKSCAGSCDLSCLELSVRHLGGRIEKLAAIIVEPIISAGGMIYPGKEYFSALRQVADDADALLIVDEAQTGFGRCGQWFDFQNLDLKPDVLVFSKTSGNGYPSSGVLVSDRIKERLVERGFHHLSSHQNDPLSATAVKTVIDIIRRDQLLTQCQRNGAYFLERLAQLERASDHLWGARGRGLMLAFELVTDKESRQPHHEMLTPFILACKARGVHLTYTYYEGTIRIIPPINLAKSEIDFAVEVIGSVLKDLKEGRLNADANAQKNPVIRDMLKHRPVKRMFRRAMETSPKYWLRRLRSRG